MSTENKTKTTGSVELKRELGLAAATAIVVGNVIGSGIFMSPASLAAATNPKSALLAWVITAVGSLLIALSFANMGAAIPKTGGPIAYTRAAFGSFPAFLIAWTYWIGAWVGNAAIITAFMSYFTYFVPALKDMPMACFLICTGILWIFTLVNILGVKEAGMVGIVTTALKIVPLLVFIVLAALNFNSDLLNTASKPEFAPVNFGTVSAGIGIALWAFVGLESATIPAGEIKNPEKNIRRSTIFGTLICAIIYILVSFFAMGSMDQATLAESSSPLADVINKAIGGTWGGTFIALGAVISTLGATSGWILTTARSGFAGAEGKLFPQIFGKVHPRFKTPYASLIISGVAANLLLILNYVNGLRAGFDFMILLATLAFLPAYSFTAAAEIVLLKKGIKQFNFFNFIKSSFFALLAFIYSIYAIYGTGQEVVMYGFLLMLVGIPFYVYQMLQNNKEDKMVDTLRQGAGLDV